MHLFVLVRREKTCSQLTYDEYEEKEPPRLHQTSGIIIIIIVNECKEGGNKFQTD